jgi:two-component system, sensor histidine kinase
MVFMSNNEEMEKRKLGFAICGNYYKELQTIVNDYDNIKTLCIKPSCLYFAEEEKNRLLKQIKDLKQNTELIHILTPTTCIGYKFEETSKNCIQNNCPTFCSELFASKPFLDQMINDGYYIVTPGWILNWKSIVQNKWKFSEHNAKQFFNDTVKWICVLDTGVYKDYTGYLDEFAKFVNLEYKIIHIGLDYFRFNIEKLITAWLHDNEIKDERNKVKETQKKLADYTMALEILKDLSNLSSEKALVNNIFQLFTILFSPQKMLYIPINDNEPGEIQDYSLSDIQKTDFQVKNNNTPYYELSKSQKGFRINAYYEKEVLGYIEVENILFTEHIDSYTALTNSISSVLGLLIYNSRQYGKILKEKIEILETSEHHLKVKNEELQALYMELQVTEEEIRSSNEELRATADELIEMNTQLEAAKRKAEESDCLKTAFLHNMSHEIRTPLNAILGFSSMLPEYFNRLDKLEYFSEIVNRRGNDLLEIIDGILDIAKIESGQMPVHMDKCNLGKLLSDIETFFKEYQIQINKTHLSFSVFNSFKDSEMMIVTDAVKLKQTFINLINNAFKFTNEGKIEVGFLGIENDTLTFFVADSGIGIPKEKHAEIFNRFIQVNYDTSRLYGGTGLGLSIVQGLLNLLGGKIWLESEPGQGSTFYFSIPYKPAENINSHKNKAKSPVQPIKSNAVILIVEDDLYNAQYLKEVLSKLNCEIIHTSSGIEAIELSVKKNLDIILMDIRLPDMNGFEASSIIKQEKPDLIIIAQTAYATSSDHLKALESGCDDYISKPVKSEILLSKISNIISKSNLIVL